MAWTTSTRILRLLQNTTLRDRLFAVDAVFTQAVFDQYEQEARSRVVARLLYAGYSDPGTTLTADSTTEGFLAGIVEAIMVSEAFANSKGIQWPPGVERRVESALTELQLVYEKKLPVPGLTPSTESGYGGSSASETSEDADSSRPQRMSREELAGY